MQVNCTVLYCLVVLQHSRDMRHSFLTLVGSQFGSYWIHRTATTPLFHNVLKVILRTQNPIELASHTPTTFGETKIFNTLPAKRTICKPSSDEEDLRRRFWSDTSKNILRWFSVHHVPDQTFMRTPSSMT
jgi:hypothetical protein